MWCSCGSFMSLLICGASRWLVYSRLRLSLPSCQSSQPVWESHLPLAVSRLRALLHPEEPPLCPLHQSVRPSDQLAQWVSSSTLYLHASGNNTTSSSAINKKLKQMWPSAECFAFLWLLCEWSHRAVNGWAWLGRGMYGQNIHTFNCHTDIRGTSLESLSENIHHLISDKYIWSHKWPVYLLNPSASVCVVVSYSDNSSACLSMLSSHDNWSGLQMPTHSSMMPMAHNSTSGTNSRFVYFLFFLFYCINSTVSLTNTKKN